MTRRPVIVSMLVVAVLLDVVYWSLWFGHRDWIASRDTQAYYDFENAFPLADAWLGVACVLALVTLRARRPSALFWLLAAGSAGAYLFAMDLLYDLEHGIFTSGAGGAVEAAIVTLTFVFSVTVLTWTWRHRHELLSPEVSDRSDAVRGTGETHPRSRS